MSTYRWIAAAAQAHLATRGSHRHERGEGVISAAIVVLIMALLGASMWVFFNKVWTDTSSKTEDNVKTIGANPNP
ncbi:MAG: hypothetical protein HYX32_05710 [Actinobacteria bacterium]|nr:hypothetical protein [Actinomycetota bacterium]